MQRADQRVRRYGGVTLIPLVRWIVAVLLTIPLSEVAGVETSSGKNAVRIRRLSTANYISLVIENRGAYDVTVTLTIHVENAQVTRIVPETSTCGGHSQIEAARIAVADAGKPWRGRYRFHWAKGSMLARHDEQTRYRLPFRKGETHRVSQGYNDRWTHHGQDRYAVDFAMPEGTTVCAAREGIVVDFQESSKAGGSDKKYKDEDNYVSIAHADGTIGEYHHLKYDGVLVEIGDQVAAGQPIALSGNTGYSTLPHLHFGVYSAIDGSHRRSHRVTFVAHEGTVTEPLAGETYTAE
jgi:murein DD-endopeptidase MepM/ murein hydrolase activator NlpD